MKFIFERNVYFTTLAVISVPAFGGASGSSDKPQSAFVFGQAGGHLCSTFFHFKKPQLTL